MSGKSSNPASLTCSANKGDRAFHEIWTGRIRCQPVSLYCREELKNKSQRQNNGPKRKQQARHVLCASDLVALQVLCSNVRFISLLEFVYPSRRKFHCANCLCKFPFKRCSHKLSMQVSLGQLWVHVSLRSCSAQVSLDKLSANPEGRSQCKCRKEFCMQIETLQSDPASAR